MPVGFALTIPIIGAFTVLALAPPRRPPVLARAGYLLGLTVSEVPHLAAGVPFALATASAVASGRLTWDVPSVVLLAAAALVWFGLWIVARRGMRAPDAVATGLAAARVAVPAKPPGWAWRTALTPWPGRPRNVTRIADLPYGEDRRQRLDVYHRSDLPEGRPVLVYFHGGGYSSGSKHREGRALLHRLAARGWVCISATYRLRPQHGFDEHLDDASSVIAWAQRNAGTYGADPERLVMAGSSAGAHLTALCALAPDTPVRAAVCLYGYYGPYYARADESTPSNPSVMPAQDAPPFFIAHGDLDTLVPARTARNLTARLRSRSRGPVVGIELPGGQHGFDLVRSWRYSAVLAGIDAFLSDPRVDLGADRSST